jgi:putative transposase
MVQPSRNPNARRAYEFIKAHRREYPVETMCRVLEVAPSGYYEWLHTPVSNRALEDARLLRLIRASYKASHGIYGAPRIFLDLREAGEMCSKHRVERIMRVYRNRDLATADISEYIEFFYNPTRRHSYLGGVSPEEFEVATKRR